LPGACPTAQEVLWIGEKEAQLQHAGAGAQVPFGLTFTAEGVVLPTAKTIADIDYYGLTAYRR